MAAPQPDGGAGAPPQADRDVDAYILARFPNPTNALFGALQLGDVAAVRRTLLRPGADAAQLFEVEMEGTTWPAEYDSGSEGEQGPPSSTILVSMLGGAAVGDCAAAVPLLLEAGAQVTLRDINQAIACGSVDVLAALLAAAQPRAPAGNGGLRWPEYDYACPLWSALWAAGTRGVCCSAAMAELLLAWYLTDKSAQECACDEVYTVSWLVGMQHSGAATASAAACPQAGPHICRPHATPTAPPPRVPAAQKLLSRAGVGLGGGCPLRVPLSVWRPQ